MTCELPFIVTIAILGAMGGFAAGLLGFGGGVVMFPLLFYVPPLLGFEKLDPKAVAALVVSQVFFSTLIGGAAHWRSGRVHLTLTLAAGLSSAAGAFMGGIGSKWVSESFLFLLFGVVTLLVGAMMLLPAPPSHREEVPVEMVTVPTLPLSIVSVVIGAIIGFLGAGNFVFVPLLIYVLKVPTRISIGSSLFIAMLNTFSGFLGKLLTWQIPLLMALVIIPAGIAGALAGESLHRRLSPQVLRHIYAAMVAVITVRIWITLLVGD
ncbi:MAG: sulfite exporter TauE/SafE family protein [Deltaproteobacteria bacterium]|nr:sulfite exporter TauE/SafE family protein [Deltaproteobacteria bacterium]